MIRRGLSALAAGLAAGLALLWLGGCDAPPGADPAVQQQNVDDELKAMENAKAAAPAKGKRAPAGP